MRPYVICHMMSSLDGKTDPEALALLGSGDEFESTGDLLNGDAWMCGRITLQKDFAEYAEQKQFKAARDASVDKWTVHVASKTGSYAVAADTLGKIFWKTSEIDGDHIIALLTEQVSSEYLSMLRDRGVSYIVSGTKTLDFAKALNALHEDFGIEKLLLEGGGHINGALLSAGLVDEVSLVLLPGLDGRHEISASFDGRKTEAADAFRLKLKSVTPRDNDILWLRYLVRRD